MTSKVLSNPSRILVLGDSHGNTAFVDQALKLADIEGAQVVHVVGDFGIWTHIQEGTDFLNIINDQAERLGLVVTFTDGNHENFDHLYSYPVDDDGWRRVRPHIWHAPRGHIWRWGGITLMSMGGAHSIDGPGGVWRQARGPLGRPQTRNVRDENGFIAEVDLPIGFDLGGWWPQELITDEDVQTAIQNMTEWANETPWGEIDVFLSHDAPSVTNIPGITGYPAGDDNRAKLQKVYEAAWPQLLVHGHYHRFSQYHDRFLDCLHVGLAHDGGNSGQYMFIDTSPFGVTIPSWQGA